MPRLALHTLARRVGIIAAYLDQSGTERRHTSDETRVALLAAMGLDASSEDAARRTLADLAARDAERLLAPARVLVCTGDAPATVRAALPRGRGPVAWDLELREEGGAVHRASGEGRETGRALELPLPTMPLGYHTLRLTLRGRGEERQAEQSLIVVPPRCPSPRELLGGRRVFGVTANLYTVRSRRNWGAGDLTDLGELLAWAGEIGAAFVGVNPLHALRNRDSDISPYRPVSRLFRNVLYLDVEAVPELATSSEARVLLAEGALHDELARLRETPRVEYERVMALKRPVLEALHRTFTERHRGPGDAHTATYDAYVREQGSALADFATFCALEERHGASWHEWPAEYRDPRSPAVAAFCDRHAGSVDFHRWLQFEIDRQLGDAARRARDAGLPIGLYQDLAIGTAPDGSDTWMFPSLFLDGVSVGAPPDFYSSTGQNWGLPPIDPRRLADDGYRYWVALARSGFRHAGALRIDHVLGLFRQFWIPAGRTGMDGAYVRFPTDDLLGILALEAMRAGALVVGEDLGTVPREVPPGLARWGVLSSKVLLFERDRRGAFRPARDYSRMALATINTHDMAPIAGYWAGRDIDVRHEVGILDDANLAGARRSRDEERAALVRLLAGEGLLPDEQGELTDADLRAALHAFLRRTPSWLVGLSLDDLVGEAGMVNVPGVGPERFPSWTRRLTVPIEALRDGAEVRRALGVERAW